MTPDVLQLEYASVEQTERIKRLRSLGIYTPDALSESVAVDAKEPYIVEGLLRAGSVNLLVGDSGLGKTPLAIQAGLCVAAGMPLFGRKVHSGPVLYCDAETGKAEFCETVITISKFLGLTKPPDNFYVWSPNWEGERPEGDSWKTHGGRLPERVKAVQPVFVIVDALRPFYPDAEGKNDEAAKTLAIFRKFKWVTWLLLHHRRKTNRLLVDRTR